MSGVTDMITGAGNARLQRKADASGKEQKKVIDRILAMYDEYTNSLSQANASGLDNADEQIRLADQVSARGQEIDSASAASNAAILGYRKGDSVPIDAVKAIDQDYSLKRQAQRYDIRQKTASNKLQRIAGAPVGGLGMAIGGLGQQQQNYLSQMQDPSAFFRAALSYGTGFPKRGGSGGNGGLALYQNQM